MQPEFYLKKFVDVEDANVRLLVEDFLTWLFSRKLSTSYLFIVIMIALCVSIDNSNVSYN